MHTVLTYIDLARGKSKALGNIQSLLKQNIQSSNLVPRSHSGRGRSGYEINNRVMLSGEGNGIDLITEKATLHVQHTFFVHFFAVVLHDYNVKLPETSQLHVLWRKLSYVLLTFLLPLIFTLEATSSSHLSFLLSLLHKTWVTMRFPAEITLSCIWVAIPVD